MSVWKLVLATAPGGEVSTQLWSDGSFTATRSRIESSWQGMSARVCEERSEATAPMHATWYLSVGAEEHHAQARAWLAPTAPAWVGVHTDEARP